jgi:hypothetical protein
VKPQCDGLGSSTRALSVRAPVDRVGVVAAHQFVLAGVERYTGTWFSPPNTVFWMRPAPRSGEIEPGQRRRRDRGNCAASMLASEPESRPT